MGIVAEAAFEEYLKNLAHHYLPKALTSLIGLQNEAQAQINRIEGKVDLLVGRPYKAALMQLQLAAQPSLTDEYRIQHLDRAVDYFSEAVAVASDADLVPQSWAYMGLSSVYHLKHQSAEARHWAEQAHASAVKAVELACDRAEKLPLGRIPVKTKHVGALVQVGSVIVGVGLIAGVASYVLRNGIAATTSLAALLVYAGIKLLKDSKGATGGVSHEIIARRVEIIKEMDRHVRDVRLLALQVGVPPERVPQRTLLTSYAAKPQYVASS